MAPRVRVIGPGDKHFHELLQYTLQVVELECLSQDWDGKLMPGEAP